MERSAIEQQVLPFWDEQILPALIEYVRIPNESPAFDKEWEAHGHMQSAVELVTGWIERQAVPGLKLRVFKDGGRTPLILAEVPGALPEVVLMYGHVDKQPPMVGWREDLGPWQPVREGDKLYGRGAADDGYAVFAAIATAKALQALGQPHATLKILIECSEESGSTDLPHYLQAYGAEFGEPNLVVCLDSGCGNYEQLWSTTSLRGLVGCTLRVEMLREGVHSGIAGGVVPNPLQVVRLLLDRLEDPATGRLKPEALHVEIPEQRIAQARKTAQVLGGAVTGDFPFLEGVRALGDDTQQLLLASTWEPAMAAIAQEGLPELGKGGNVLLPGLALRLSLRIPPTLDPKAASEAVKRTLEADPPFGARVTVTTGGEPGWNAPPLADWLGEATDAASREFYGKEACYWGIGGSIPFMHMIGERFPDAQFLITGVLGPNSNAHGPNEFLHVPYAARLTCCLVRILAAHHDRYAR
ncbi:MAG TPA: M20/M25/M40 family metallo-hydrolase [bacterium]|nr:M20/M25/M40 family metallo-hydrolase [bacterium]